MKQCYQYFFPCEMFAQEIQILTVCKYNVVACNTISQPNLRNQMTTSYSSLTSELSNSAIILLLLKKGKKNKIFSIFSYNF